MSSRTSLPQAAGLRFRAGLLLFAAAASAAGAELKVERIGSLAHARAAHGAAQLRDGQVLVAGGSAYHLAVHVVEAELVDPVTGRSRPAGELLLPRSLPTVLARPEGGAFVFAGSRISYYRPLALVESWSPSDGRFRAHADLLEPRSIGLHAEVLPGGDLLVVGGTVDGRHGEATDAIERVPAQPGPSRLVGRLALPRAGFSTAPLDGSRRLLAGGDFRCCGHPLNERSRSSCELLRLDGSAAASQLHELPGPASHEELQLLALSSDRILALAGSSGLRRLVVSDEGLAWEALPSPEAAELPPGVPLPLGESAVLVVAAVPGGPFVHDARTGQRLAEPATVRFPTSAVWTPLADGCVLVTGGREPNGAAVDDIWRVCLQDAAR